MKRITKLTALFVILCIAAVFVCGCAKGNITINADKMLGKVTAYDGKSITVEIGASGFDENNFPGNISGNMTPPGGTSMPGGASMPDGMTPPGGTSMPDGMTPPDDTASSQDVGSSGFVEEENRETGFGGFGDRENAKRINGAFLSTGVTVKLRINADVKVTDASGNAVEIKTGDVVLLTLGADTQVTAITLYEQYSGMMPKHR